MKRLLWVILLTLLTPRMMAPMNGNLCLIEESRISGLAHSLIEKEFRESTFNPTLFYEALLFLQIQQPEIVFRQSVLETGWFTSSSFKDYNNLFGMKKPSYRETLCIGIALGHGVFESWYDAVKDYKLWQEYWLENDLSQDEYYYFLDTLPYAEAKNYTKILKKVNLEDLLGQPLSRKKFNLD